jgi:hypothetical protein
VAVLEEQLQELTDKYANLDRELADRGAELSEVRLALSSRDAEVERERVSQLELRSSLESSESVLRQSMESLKNENENLIKQIDMLQKELSMVGQDLSVLQKQDTFRASLSTASQLS